MSSRREIVLCRYRYDPLDRLTATTPLSAAELQRFYCKSRLATEIQGQVKHSIFQHDDQLLAQQRRSDNAFEATLLATDQQRSVLQTLSTSPPQPIAYSPYGHRPAENGLLSLLGFNGERRDPVTGHYLLGNGYRAFNPVLMRFNSPDSLSPFGKGGVNPYAYCLGDPINQSDPTGHMPLAIFLKKYYIKKGIAGLDQAKISKATTKNVATGNLVDNVKIAKDKIKALPTMLDESETLERALTKGTIQPLEITTDPTAAIQNYYKLRNSNMPVNSAGIPNPKEPITAINASGQEYLRTDFYSDTISFALYEAGKTVSPTYKAIMQQLAGEALIKRAKYIRRHALWNTEPAS
ncbi:RHS repeat-associated core domain-containing protein [Pseudomonas fluorescens]|uniref:Teneurin-like YD-shell domain-containing protein n=1 Tax=Pseudomonas fluorescens TaxID=294 RepID=A0A5E7BDA0_PSEFL|nr:RHS repeat-associated core domain-containing protein [Pseudomonas fluorescens]VVN90202.1 hypothetical protein PS691_01804 [Pseudomonas fluorescens]